MMDDEYVPVHMVMDLLHRNIHKNGKFVEQFNKSMQHLSCREKTQFKLKLSL